MIPHRNVHARFAAACLFAGVAWILVEVGGGLAFLAAGVRLWRYDIVPLFWEITSPVVWVFAVTLIVPLSVAFDRRVSHRFHGWRKVAVRLVFLMTVGPVLEVLINEHLFKALVGRPLYEYLVLPLFNGSSSLLSPLYYATLLIHVPITDRLLAPRRAKPPMQPAWART
jgi:hypothetical protein